MATALVEYAQVAYREFNLKCVWILIFKWISTTILKKKANAFGQKCSVSSDCKNSNCKNRVCVGKHNVKFHKLNLIEIIII